MYFQDSQWYRPAGPAHKDCIRPSRPRKGLAPFNRLANGESWWRPGFGDIIVDEPRAFDILLEYPRSKVPVWRRPWTSQFVLDSYPVEYRAFVLDGRIAGISNYYPQRPLYEDTHHIDKVRQLTEKLIHAVKAPFQWPLSPVPDDIDPAGVHFTADFIVTANATTFLEGGPPHEMGAHPCCFRPFEISGVALEDRNEPEDP